MPDYEHGIHHITAIATDPQKNIDFYSGVLGLRLIKQTVNFDDPSTYHFYYGDEMGRPGTILTFFPWGDVMKGRPGSGQVTATAFLIPHHSMGCWLERLKRLGVSCVGPRRRFDEEVISFSDPDGLALEIVTHNGAHNLPAWERGWVPAEHALRGTHSVTLVEKNPESTADILTEHLGFRSASEENDRSRYVSGTGPGTVVDILSLPDAARGIIGAGSVHHVAWRTRDEDSQISEREALVARDLNVTSQIDRKYFRSIYFREPGGVLFEIATDPPGFAVDEKPEDLGRALQLPSSLESSRPQIEETLPPVHFPQEKR